MEIRPFIDSTSELSETTKDSVKSVSLPKSIGDESLDSGSTTSFSGQKRSVTSSSSPPRKKKKLNLKLLDENDNPKDVMATLSSAEYLSFCNEQFSLPSLTSVNTNSNPHSIDSLTKAYSKKYSTLSDVLSHPKSCTNSFLILKVLYKKKSTSNNRAPDNVILADETGKIEAISFDKSIVSNLNLNEWYFITKIKFRKVSEANIQYLHLPQRFQIHLTFKTVIREVKLFGKWSYKQSESIETVNQTRTADNGARVHLGCSFFTQKLPLIKFSIFEDERTNELISVGGANVVGVLMEVELKKTRDNDLYIRCLISDGTDSMLFNIFNIEEKDFKVFKELKEKQQFIGFINFTSKQSSSGSISWNLKKGYYSFNVMHEMFERNFIVDHLKQSGMMNNSFRKDLVVNSSIRQFNASFTKKNDSQKEYHTFPAVIESVTPGYQDVPFSFSLERIQGEREYLKYNISENKFYFENGDIMVDTSKIGIKLNVKLNLIDDEGDKIKYISISKASIGQIWPEFKDIEVIKLFNQWRNNTSSFVQKLKNVEEQSFIMTAQISCSGQNYYKRIIKVKICQK